MKVGAGFSLHQYLWYSLKAVPAYKELK